MTRAALAVGRILIADDALLYITPELWHLLERPANLPIASPILSYLRVLRPGRYLKRWGRRLTEEGFSHEDAMILSYTFLDLMRWKRPLALRVC
jgi:hypothetical protein